MNLNKIKANYSGRKLCIWLRYALVSLFIMKSIIKFMGYEGDSKAFIKAASNLRERAPSRGGK